LTSLDQKTKSLIAIGASIAINCQQWLEVHYYAARAAGANELEIREVIDLAEMVKETAMMNSRIMIDTLINELCDDKE